MHTFFAEVREMLVPDLEGRHGPLPPLLVGLTFLTGLVDAFSYLGLGHIFVANMTGNVVLLGFALVGTKGFSITASLAAIAFFTIGATVGGKLTAALGNDRGQLVSTATTIQSVLLGVGVLFAALSGHVVRSDYRYELICVLALAMGIQNAMARKLAVPDLTTTVLTLTITGIAADSGLGEGHGSKAGHRLIAVGAMLLGAVIGAVLVIHGHLAWPLVIALVIAVVVSVATRLFRRDEARWLRPGD